jgi:hypothetical protein
MIIIIFLYGLKPPAKFQNPMTTVLEEGWRRDNTVNSVYNVPPPTHKGSGGKEGSNKNHRNEKKMGVTLDDGQPTDSDQSHYWGGIPPPKNNEKFVEFSLEYA